MTIEKRKVTRCIWCVKPREAGVFCAECAEKNRTRCTERYRFLRSHGLCAQCKRKSPTAKCEWCRLRRTA